MYRRWMLCLLAAVMLAGQAAGEGYMAPSFDNTRMELSSNRYTQPEAQYEKVESALDTQGFALVCATQAGELWLSREFHTLRLVDKRTGYVWGAIPTSDARNLNKSWQSYGGSIVSIECYDAKNNEKRYGLLDNAQVAYTIRANGFDFSADFQELGISFLGGVTLEGEKLTFEITEGSLQETGEYRLKSLAFMPYLGSVYGDEISGWFLLPDGPGALMRFLPSGSYIAGYDKKIYGKDPAVDQMSDAQTLNANRPDDYLMADNQILMPIYGIAHGVGQQGLLCVVEDGWQYASVVATPAGLGNTRYNSIMARFEYRQKYNRASNRSGAGALVPQETMNELTPKQAFYLCAGEAADYGQMANRYRGILENGGGLPQGSDAMALRLEVVGGDVKSEALFKRRVTFTTLPQAGEMAAALQAGGVDRLYMVLRGYTNKNLAGESLERGVGSESQLRELQQALSSWGTLWLYVDPVRANADQINLRLQAANAMSTSPSAILRNNYDAMYPQTYFYRPWLVVKKAEEHLRRYGQYPVAADQLSSLFYGDYTSGHEANRRENIGTFLQTVARVAQVGQEQAASLPALYAPNQIMWPYAGSFFDLPLVSSQYLYETDTVPFLPMVLKGSTALFAPSLNTGAFSRQRILRMIEYGAYPSFIVTNEKSAALTRTPLEDLYSTCFEDWEAYILETYAYVKQVLGAVEGKRMVSHRTDALGCVAVGYEDGTMVYINYTGAPWNSPGGQVGPLDCLVVKGGMAK